MKSKFSLILILAFLIFMSFYYGTYIKRAVLLVNDNVIKAYYNAKTYIIDTINEHFNQVEEIRTLRAKNESLEQMSMLASTFAEQLNRLLGDKNSTQYFPKISLVKAISYVQISDYKRVWLSFSTNLHNTRNKGLIYQGYTAGIAVVKDGRLMAILQGDEQCVFSVYIGENKVPGVAQGKNGKVIVNFIPKSYKINIGDEVLTSGLDEIFFSGVPVGRVVSVFNENMYQSVELESFAEIDIPSYMYLIERF